MKTTSYQGYQIKPHQWVEVVTEYGQYDIWVGEKRINHEGFKITKGRKEIGRTKTVLQAKSLIKNHRKYSSKKVKSRIKTLKKQAQTLRKEALRREKSPNSKIRSSAASFYHRSKVAADKCFNLEMRKPENYHGYY